MFSLIKDMVSGHGLHDEYTFPTKMVINAGLGTSEKCIVHSCGTERLR